MLLVIRISQMVFGKFPQMSVMILMAVVMWWWWGSKPDECSGEENSFVAKRAKAVPADPFANALIQQAFPQSEAKLNIWKWGIASAGELSSHSHTEAGRLSGVSQQSLKIPSTLLSETHCAQQCFSKGCLPPAVGWDTPGRWGAALWQHTQVRSFPATFLKKIKYSQKWGQ